MKWNKHTTKPKTKKIVSGLLAGFDSGCDDPTAPFLFGIYLWKRGKWVSEDCGRTARAPFYWVLERDVVASLSPPSTRSVSK